MVVVIRQTDSFMSASSAEFDNEAELEQVLADQVSLLQGAADHRLAFVARQVDLSDVGAGTLDLLCVDENGVPVAVEVKLARNSESRREVVALDPDTFMVQWEGACGADAAAAWRTFVEAVRRSEIAGLEIGYYRNGAPYIYLSHASVGTVRVLRLNDKRPEVRDLLHEGSTTIWEPNRKAAEARHKFRRTLVERVPGAVLGGVANRVYAPVKEVAEHRDAVIEAISELAKELAMAAAAPESPPARATTGA